MKMYVQEYFNRNYIIDLLAEMADFGSQPYLAVGVLESMRVTFAEEAVKDKIFIYNCYVNHTLKYTEAVKIHEIENIAKKFLLRYCPDTEEVIRADPSVSLNDIIERCSLHYPELTTYAKCVFAFLYAVNLINRIEVPSFMSAFSPYRFEKFKDVGTIPSVSDKNEYYMYYQLDRENPTEILGTVMGAYSVHLCVFDSNNEIRYCIRMIDEECLVADYTDSDNTLYLLNKICKTVHPPFKAV